MAPISLLYNSSIIFPLKAYFNCVSDCVPIGVADPSTIPDKSFTASSYFSYRYEPHFARLNGPKYWTTTVSGRDRAWLQIDLGKAYTICAIATQGSPNMREWCKEYVVSLSLNGDLWIPYKENGRSKASVLFISVLLLLLLFIIIIFFFLIF